MSIVLTIMYYAFEHVQLVQPLPIPDKKFSPPSPSAKCDDCRTTWNIIWSCLVTMFSCTWVAVHPNIPALDESWFSVGLRRTKIALVGVIAPELLLLWAMRQWWSAHKVAKKYRSEGWTLTHGFFLTMGGFVISDGDNLEAPHTLLEDEFNKLILDGTIVLPKITKGEIDDKSKGDVISKGFMVVQMGWFTLQCIARGYEHLPITALEISTLAFAILNLATYAFWWSKPLNVQCAVPVSIVKPHIYVSSSACVLRHHWHPPDLTRDFLRQKTRRRERVTTFHSGDSGRIAALPVIWVSMVFGVIHLTAWSSPFPSHSDKFLWRTCSLAITSLPMTILLAWSLFGIVHGLLLLISHKYASDSHAVLFVCVQFIMVPFAACLIYVVSRATLLVEAFVSLKSLPPEAFQTIQWTTFIPHV